MSQIIASYYTLLVFFMQGNALPHEKCHRKADMPQKEMGAVDYFNK